MCSKHYAATSDRGYRDAQPVRDRIELLISRGVGATALHEATGLSISYLRHSDAERVQKRVHDAIFAIPVPRGYVDAKSSVPGIGTTRRLQGLMAMGWPASTLSVMLGMERSWSSKELNNTGWVYASTAVRVAELCDRLSAKPGPSSWVRRYALARGWVPVMAWDDIDDPDETPNMGDVVKVEFPDQFRELREHCGLPLDQIADRMGVKLESLERQLMRHGMFEGRAA